MRIIIVASDVIKAAKKLNKNEIRQRSVFLLEQKELNFNASVWFAFCWQFFVKTKVCTPFNMNVDLGDMLNFNS